MLPGQWVASPLRPAALASEILLDPRKTLAQMRVSLTPGAPMPLNGAAGSLHHVAKIVFMAEIAPAEERIEIKEGEDPIGIFPETTIRISAKNCRFPGPSEIDFYAPDVQTNRKEAYV